MFDKFDKMIICICIIILISVAGCVNQSARNTVLSANNVINSENAFINQETAFSDVVQSHTATWDSDMLTINNQRGGAIYYPFLYSNIQSDLTTIDSFTPHLEDINTQIISYSGQTTNLNGNVQQYADRFCCVYG